LDRRYVAANPAFQRMTGYSEAELRRLSPADITHEDDQATTETIIAAQIAGKPYVQHREKRYLRKDGGVVWAEVEAFLAPVAGSPPLLAGVAVDITERKRAEEALRDARADLERMARLTTMGEFTASIAHEINQPLAAIVTQSEAALRFLDRDEPDLDEVQDSLSSIRQDGTRAGEVIRGLRALARKSGPQPTKLDINDVIRQVLAIARAELLRHNIVLRTELASGEQLVLGDRVQLQQVLLNLIMNSVERGNGAHEGAFGFLDTRRARKRAGRGRGHRRGAGPGGRGTHVPALLHDETRRPRHGPSDLPVDCRSPWRAFVGVAARAARRGCPICYPVMGRKLAVSSSSKQASTPANRFALTPRC
jgi:PAS domain S-box-containing protein